MARKTYVQHITSFIDNMRAGANGATPKPAGKEDKIEGTVWELEGSEIEGTTIELGATASVEGTVVSL